MQTARPAAIFLFTGAALFAACSSSGEGASAPIAPDSTITTTVDRVVADDLASSGQVTIGETQYDFAFECFTEEEGQVLALGVGEEPGSAIATQAVVQAFSNQPYVSVVAGGERILELALEAPVELFVQSGTISGSALRFVDSQGEVGVGNSLGLGAVSVNCESFAPDLPPEYSSN